MQQTASISQDPRSGYTTGVETGKLGMWLFLASEVMFFAALIGSYIVLRLGRGGDWPDPKKVLGITVLAINTCILITSSVTMVLGLQAIQRGDRKKLKLYLILTILLGLSFLTIKIVDYVHLISEYNPEAPAEGGLTIGSSLLGTCYFTLTGFHGLHVLAGVVLMLVMLRANAKGKFSADDHVGIENTGLYWHFVDVVWIILFTILCLI